MLALILASSTLGGWTLKGFVSDSPKAVRPVVVVAAATPVEQKAVLTPSPAPKSLPATETGTSSSKPISALFHRVETPAHAEPEPTKPAPPPVISWADRWYWHFADRWGQAFDGIDRDDLINLIGARNAGLPHKWPHTVRACPGPHETPAQTPPAVVYRWLPRN